MRATYVPEGYSIQKHAICEYKPLCGVTPDKQEQDVSLTW